MVALTRKRGVSLTIIAVAMMVISAACSSAPTPAAPAPVAPAAAPAPVGPAPVAPARAAPAAPLPAAPAAPALSALAVPKPAAVIVPVAPIRQVPAEGLPRQGGIAVQGAGNNVSTWDVHRAAALSQSYATAKVYNSLMRNPTGTTLECDLCETFELSSDGKTLDFKLLEGVRFHNGKVMDAEDVKYSIEKIIGVADGVTAVRAGLIKEYLDLNDPVDLVGERTVRLNMTRSSDAPFFVLGLVNAGIMPKDYPAQEAGNAPIGTGPFLRTDYVSGSHIVFDRFVDYFREGLPYLNGLRVEIVRSATLREAAFLTGKLDIELNSFPYSPQNEPILVKKVNNGEVHRQQIRVDVLQGIIFNTADPVFSDKRVRQAAHLAVDRDGLIATVYNNKGKVRVLFVDEPFGRPEAEIRELPGFRQPKDEDLAEARRLMTEAGYPDGVDVTILTRGDSGSYRRLTEYLAGELAKIGIRAKIDLQDGAVVYDKMGIQEFQLAGMRLSQATAHPDEAIGGYFITGASRDWMNYSNSKVDELYLKISSSTDPVEKKALIREVEDILLDEVPMVLTADALGDYVWYSYVKGLEFGLSRYHSIQRFDTVWLDN